MLALKDHAGKNSHPKEYHQLHYTVCCLFARISTKKEEGVEITPWWMGRNCSNAESVFISVLLEKYLSVLFISLHQLAEISKWKYCNDNPVHPYVFYFHNDFFCVQAFLLLSETGFKGTRLAQQAKLQTIHSQCRVLELGSWPLMCIIPATVTFSTQKSPPLLKLSFEKVAHGNLIFRLNGHFVTTTLLLFWLLFRPLSCMTQHSWLKSKTSYHLWRQFPQ